MRPKKLIARIRRGQVRNVGFDDLVRLLEAVGFRLDRVRGSHRVFRHPRVGRPIVVQDVAGQAKGYQVRQVLQVIESYNLAPGEEP